MSPGRPAIVPPSTAGATPSRRNTHIKTRNGLLLALGAGVLVTALAGTDAAAQRGRNNQAASSSVQCASGAQPSAATNAAQ